jgi:hypothetical protein
MRWRDAARSRHGFGENPWDVARRRRLTRSSIFGKPQPIDSGVNFFVEALERMGAKPQASCDGHGDPCGFYVLFGGNEKLARRIKNAGFFKVEIERDALVLPGLPRPSRTPLYSIRLGPPVGGPCCRKAEADLARTLRWAAEAWLPLLGRK